MRIKPRYSVDKKGNLKPDCLHITISEREWAVIGSLIIALTAAGTLAFVAFLIHILKDIL